MYTSPLHSARLSAALVTDARMHSRRLKFAPKQSCISLLLSCSCALLLSSSLSLFFVFSLSLALSLGLTTSVLDFYLTLWRSAPNSQFLFPACSLLFSVFRRLSCVLIPCSLSQPWPREPCLHHRRALSRQWSLVPLLCVYGDTVALVSLCVYDLASLISLQCLS